MQPLSSTEEEARRDAVHLFVKVSQRLPHTPGDWASIKEFETYFLTGATPDAKAA